MPVKDPYSIPIAMQPKYEQITRLTDAVCQEHLTTEYADLARRMTAALARKRPSPLDGGRANTWACGILYVLGQVNFLFDKSQTPHTRADELCAAFDLAASTGGNSAKKIRDLLRINIFSHEWMLPSRVDTSSLAWLITVDGLIVDARHMPREVQEVAYQKGLIPYVPDDR